MNFALRKNLFHSVKMLISKIDFKSLIFYYLNFEKKSLLAVFVDKIGI